MIVTRLHGGLGNQLFQYAAGRALTDRLGVDLVTDDRILPVKGLRPCGVHFNWRLVQASKLPPMKSDGLLRYGLWRILGSNPKFRRERGLGYNRQFERWTDETYLHGYWQTERYFASSTDQIREDLEIVTPPL